jgi:hypothetical protein
LNFSMLEGNATSDSRQEALTLSCAENYLGVRCADCRLGSYRVRSTCRKCPNTAWLLFLLFALALLAAVAAAVYLSKKKINFAGLSIGVDFVQALSMFAGFQFDWPPAIVQLFNAFSLLNFNFDILAPECSVSLNFEAKWYIVQLLPGLLFAGIGVVLVGTKAIQLVQVKLLHTLPLGALSAVSTVDVCIGVCFSGVFMLYFGTYCHCAIPCRSC